ncbi:MAG TPA: GON domain-containing protein [Nannocystaceae bacterium]|nr:GON domain-containing protein [Nannocystaceae bacterium]
MIRSVSILGLAAPVACTATVNVDTLARDPIGDVTGTSIADSTGGVTGPSEGTSASTGEGTGDTGGMFAPQSCAEVLAAAPGAVDGEYTLYADNDPARAWQAWCVDMAGTPREYLILPMSGDGFNYSEYVPGPQQAPGTTVRTTYSRIRVDPHDLSVDVSDQTFATSVGQLMHGATEVTSMPYAVAMDCVGEGSKSGRGNVDLRGTPFRVWASQWLVTGTNGGWGGAVGSANDQVMTLRGGGLCGFIQPHLWDRTEGPINDWGGFYLQLVFLE